ncbi:MAG: hypothetical protein QCH35_01115 [Methanomicrobiaceae archaeon]|nr:hypothetical protein [Methanomicrobiaceae archaeon]
MIDWLRINFNEVQPDKALAIRAIRHLKKREKIKLFSPDISQMRAAEGRWYEALVYEMLLDIAKKSDRIGAVVRKGADAPFPPDEILLGQNGLFYSTRGDIKLRGNGQDLAEFDLMLLDDTGAVAFGEIVTSPSDIKKMEEEILYKKRILGYLFGQATVPFMLFSSVDISRTTAAKRLMRQHGSTIIVTRSCEELKSLLRMHDTRGIPRKPVRNAKLIDLHAVQPKRPFDYRQLHDRRRDRVLEALVKKESTETLKKADDIPPIVKKIIFGALYPSGIRALCRETEFSIRDHMYSCNDVLDHFSKVIIAADLPGYEPVIYLRLKHKKEYLKMVPTRGGGFKVESKRSVRMKGFFLWLESVEPTLGANITTRFVDQFIKQ